MSLADSDNDDDTDKHPKVVTPTEQYLSSRCFHFINVCTYSMLSLQESVDKRPTVFTITTKA